MVHTNIRDWLRLSFINGVGPVTAKKLLNLFDTPAQFFSADEAELRDRNVSAKLIQALFADYDQQIDQALTWQEKSNHHIVCCADQHYPNLLKEIYDPPLILYAVGDLGCLNREQLAIVGSRHASHHGMEIAFEFSRDLASLGWCINSGLAYGIDAAAHNGALSANAATIAVTGTGADLVYPKRNEKLAETIARQGLLITEYPLSTQPLAQNFPRRNRIISGLSRGVIVVEAAVKSGSLITAQTALDQGREVFAVPGSIHQAQSKGCHRLLKEGAILLESLQDIDEIFQHLTGLNPQGKTNTTAASLKQLDDEYAKVLAAVDFAPTSIEQVIQRSGLTPRSVCSMLLALEMQNYVCMSEGGLYSKSTQVLT